MNKGLEKGLNQQTPLNGDCRLIPYKWGAATSASSYNCGIWGQNQGLGFGC